MKIPPQYGFFIAVIDADGTLAWASNVERPDVIAAMKRFIGEVEGKKA
jgi:hypothetical protein